MKLIVGALIILAGSFSRAAIPQQVYEDCWKDIGATPLSLDDVKEVAKNSKFIFCYNQVSSYTKKDLADLLQNKVEVGVVTSRSAYTKEDLVDMAKAGNLFLIVDNARLSKDNLAEIGQAGAQLLLVSSGASLSKAELMSLAQQKPFTMAVTSHFVKEDLKDMLNAKVQLVIYISQAMIGSYDLLDLTKTNPGMITVKP